MKRFEKVPLSITIAASAIVLLPIFQCMVWFRLYAHPQNPDAWFILAVLTGLAVVAAVLILRRVGAIRWIWCVWFGSSMFVGASKLSYFWKAGYPQLAIAVAGAWTVQIAIGVLLFLPTSNAFFRGPTEA